MKSFIAFFALASAACLSVSSAEGTEMTKADMESMLMRLVPDCDQRICLCKKTEFAFCVGTEDQPHVAEIHAAMGECALKTMDEFGEMAADMENVDEDMPCPLKDYMMHTMGFQHCLLTKMGWMNDDYSLNQTNIEHCFENSPVAEHFPCDETVQKCFGMGCLLTIENMEEFIPNMKAGNMAYFEELAAEAGYPMGEGEVVAARSLPATEEGFLNMAQNMVRLNCLKHAYQTACTAKVYAALMPEEEAPAAEEEVATA